MMTVKTFIGPSKIHGIGIFASERIPKGTQIWIFNPDVDRLLSEASIQALPKASREQIQNYAYFDSIYQAYVLCGDDARFFNHSNNPTCQDFHTEGGDITVAARDIEAGEEITSDYATFTESHAPTCLPPAPRRTRGMGSFRNTSIIPGVAGIPE